MPAGASFAPNTTKDKYNLRPYCDFYSSDNPDGFTETSTFNTCPDISVRFIGI